jgi:hypothetical protein
MRLGIVRCGSVWIIDDGIDFGLCSLMPCCKCWGKSLAFDLIKLWGRNLVVDWRLTGRFFSASHGLASIRPQFFCCHCGIHVLLVRTSALQYEHLTLTAN